MRRDESKVFLVHSTSLCVCERERESERKDEEGRREREKGEGIVREGMKKKGEWRVEERIKRL